METSQKVKNGFVPIFILLAIVALGALEVFRYEKKNEVKSFLGQ